ncbi:hypothetical protein PR048_019742 [Dryococelus australis]|uniref:Uncharacterized protein n=1 Tax=Dryococelus australis TaxID=614101 RepID=A0ABQ9H4B4_9NEOP|nr:hypothetical protein PR048_019742 [Dryococelus australis]
MWCHNLKAQAFYTLLREKHDDLLTISFDCQNYQVSPRVPNQRSVSVLRLTSDVYGGQNKKKIHDGYLSNNAPQPVGEIEHVFPIKVLSFLPPDRLFTRIEK